MTKAGIKTEDYREITPYWCKRFFQTEDRFDVDIAVNAFNEGYDIAYLNEWHLIFLKPFNYNIMTLGYPKKDDQSRRLTYKHQGIHIGTGKPEWGAEEGKLYFVIKHGKQLTAD